MPYSGTPINPTGGTCSVGGVSLGLGGTIDATVNINATLQELPVWGAHPYTHVTVTSIAASGTINYIPTTTVAITAPSASEVAVIIDSGTGFLFSATCIIESAGMVLSGTDVGKATLTFRTVGTWTITTSP